MNIEYRLLADCPNSLDQIANWYFEEWVEKEGVPKAELKADLRRFVSTDISSCAVCGFHQGRLVSTAQLKLRENKNFPNFVHWIGGVYVDNAYRGSGAGSGVVRHAISIAEARGVVELYLQTEKTDGGLSPELGFKPVCTAKHGGSDVTIFRRNLPATQ